MDVSGLKCCNQGGQELEEEKIMGKLVVEKELGFRYYKCVMIKNMRLTQVELGSHPSSVTRQLPGFGQMTSPL